MGGSGSLVFGALPSGAFSVFFFSEGSLMNCVRAGLFIWVQMNFYLLFAIQFLILSEFWNSRERLTYEAVLGFVGYEDFSIRYSCILLAPQNGN